MSLFLKIKKWFRRMRVKSLRSDLVRYPGSHTPIEYLNASVQLIDLESIVDLPHFSITTSFTSLRDTNQFINSCLKNKDNGTHYPQYVLQAKTGRMVIPITMWINRHQGVYIDTIAEFKIWLTSINLIFKELENAHLADYGPDEYNHRVMRPFIHQWQEMVDKILDAQTQ